MRTSFDDLNDDIYNLVEEACLESALEIGRDNRVEITPDQQVLNDKVNTILKLVDIYYESNVVELCRRFGLQDKCSQCKDRFTCWTDK